MNKLTQSWSSVADCGAPAREFVALHHAGPRRDDLGRVVYATEQLSALGAYASRALFRAWPLFVHPERGSAMQRSEGGQTGRVKMRVYAKFSSIVRIVRKSA